MLSYGGSSRFPVQLKQIQKQQPGDSDNDGEGKQGRVRDSLFSGKELGLVLRASVCPAELGQPSLPSPLLPRAGIIPQGICCLKLPFHCSITKHTAGEDHSCLYKNCRESNKHHPTQGSGNLLITSVDADLISEYFICVWKD